MKTISGYKDKTFHRGEFETHPYKNIFYGVLLAIGTWLGIILAFGGWTMIGGN